MAAPVQAGPQKDEEKPEVKTVPLGPMASPASDVDLIKSESEGEVDLIDSASDGDIAIDSGDEIFALSEDEVFSLGSGEEDDDCLDLGSDDDFEDLKFDISSGAASESSGEVEEIETPAFIVPTVLESVDMMRRHLVDRCLLSLFQHRGPLWARPKIDAFFQDVFYRRGALTPQQQLLVEGWQARIKSNQKVGARAVGETNNPMESQRPVIDSREMRSTFDAAGGDWAAKQTFDSRESCASKVIR